MSTHDYIIANQTFPATRADINDALAAIVSNNSNATAPATTYGNMWWYDTTANMLKIRNNGNSSWIDVGYFDQTNGKFVARVTETTAKTTAYTVVLTDRNKTILADATSVAFTVTLPTAASAGDGFVITVKKTDSSANAVTIDANGSETIDGALTQSLAGQYDNITLISNGTAWFMLGKTYGVFTSSAAGLTPASGGGTNKFLRADGTFQEVLTKPALITPSGSSIDITGIPSGVNTIILGIDNLSTNGTSGIILQLGDSGGIETSGYASATGTGTTYAALFTGIQLTPTTIAATNSRTGHVFLTKFPGVDAWTISGNLAEWSNTTTSNFAGGKLLSGVLDRLRITTLGGANTFDSGSLYIIYGY